VEGKKRTLSGHVYYLLVQCNMTHSAQRAIYHSTCINKGKEGERGGGVFGLTCHLLAQCEMTDSAQPLPFLAAPVFIKGEKGLMGGKLSMPACHLLVQCGMIDLAQRAVHRGTCIRE